MRLSYQIGVTGLLLAVGALVLLWQGVLPLPGGPGEGAQQGGGAASPAASGPARGGGRALPVVAAPIEARRLARRIEALATTRAHRAVSIVPLADGRLVDLPFTPGSRVEQGAVLARLDFAAQQADVDEAEAAVLEITQALERARRLRRGNTVTQATLDELESRRAGALARLDRARKALADRVITAPFAGRVGLRELDVGARVSAGEVITTLDDLSVLELAFQVPEQYYGALRPGLVVTARSEAFADRVFSGEISWVDPRIEARARAVRLRARLPNPDGRLPAGLFMTVDVALDERVAAVVPDRAILASGGGAAVFVIEEDRARRVDVRLGQRLEDAVEILDGPEPGTPVVAAGVHRLRDGMALRIQGPEPAGTQTGEQTASPASGSGEGGQ